MKEKRQTGRTARPAFTLIELLVVIAIIAVLAALIVPLAGIATRKSRLSRAGAELAQLQTAIESYKSEMGFYPPDNIDFSSTLREWPSPPPCISQLFYELTGTTFNGAQNPANGRYTNTLGTAINVPDMLTWFGVDGFMNAAVDESQVQNFFPTIEPGRLRNVNTNSPANQVWVISAASPGRDKALMDADGEMLNPWNYDSSSTNRINSRSYDLWVDLSIGKKIYRVSNWSEEPEVVP